MRRTTRTPEVTPERPAGPLDALVADAADGDEAAFTTLWRAIDPGLVAYALMFVDSPAKAEAIAAQAWDAVLPRLPLATDGEHELRCWLFTEVRTQVQRAMTRLDAVHHTAHDRLLFVATAALTGRPVDIGRLVGTLPAEQAEVIGLRVLGGLDLVSSAGVLDKPEDHVRLIEHRALDRLAQITRSRAYVDPESVTAEPDAEEDAA